MDNEHINTKCRHCGAAVCVEIKHTELGKDIDGNWLIDKFFCPSCERVNLELKLYPTPRIYSGASPHNSFPDTSVYPLFTNRPSCPTEVPREIADDYIDACKVLNLSAKASAALSRRCLQSILRADPSVHPGKLYDEIEEVLKTNKFPSQITDLLHAVRTVGNFAAHPEKSTNSAEIVKVDPAEAEMNLEAIESLFDFYYVQPAKNKARIDEINKKLAELGKKPIS